MIQKGGTNDKYKTNSTNFSGVSMIFAMNPKPPKNSPYLHRSSPVKIRLEVSLRLSVPWSENTGFLQRFKQPSLKRSSLAWFSQDFRIYRWNGTELAVIFSYPLGHMPLKKETNLMQQPFQWMHFAKMYITEQKMNLGLHPQGIFTIYHSFTDISMTPNSDTNICLLCGQPLRCCAPPTSDAEGASTNLSVITTNKHGNVPECSGST